MKKIVILRATGGELSNQLWNYAGIYAYALEKNLTLENPSFFEYGNYFTTPAPNFFVRLFFFSPFSNYVNRKQSFKRRLWRKIYEYYVKIVITNHRDSVLVSDNSENKPFYLPPTSENLRTREIEESANTTYFDGWLFRNPVGLKKYKKEIVNYFKPRLDIENKVAATINKLRSDYKHIVGVHIRQGDYQTWRGGAYFIPQMRVRGILDEYLKMTSNNASETCFVITSDGPVETSLFDGLHSFISKENAVHDLFLLSSTEVILGSNSTFGAFASYYGNVPHIIMGKEPIDWNYYTDKKAYFENKYCTMVHY